MASVLVTDGEERSALAVVRSLGQAGHRTLVASSQPPSLAGTSRHAHDTVRLPDSLSRPRLFAARLEEVLRARAVDVLLPITEASLLTVLPMKDQFEETIVPFPEAPAFRRISDKEEISRTASRWGCEVPEQTVVSGPEAAGDLELPAGRFPVVVKPSRSVVEASGGSVKVGVSYAADPEELVRRLGELPAAAYPVLLQKRVTGPGMGIFLLRWGDEFLATFAHRRIREKPPSGGVSVCRESVTADPELVEVSRGLLEGFDWRGVAMVEFKVDRSTGKKYLMEVNGRFWGSLQLAIDAGVDFPRLLVGAALGESPEPIHRYDVGIRSRWFWGDVDHVLARLRTSAGDPALPDDAPGRLRTLVEFLLCPFRGGRSEVFRSGDLKPFLHESRRWLAAVPG